MRFRWIVFQQRYPFTIFFVGLALGLSLTALAAKTILGSTRTGSPQIACQELAGSTGVPMVFRCHVEQGVQVCRCEALR